MYVSPTVYHVTHCLVYLYYLLSYYYLHSYISFTYLCQFSIIYLIIHVSTHPLPSIIYVYCLSAYQHIYRLLPISYPIICLCICIWIYQSYVIQVLWIGARVWRTHTEQTGWDEIPEYTHFEGRCLKGLKSTRKVVF